MTNLQIARRHSARAFGIAALAIGLCSPPSLGCRSSSDDGETTGTGPLVELEGQDLLVAVPGGDTIRRARVRHLPATMGEALYLDTDDALRVEGDGITIADLQALAREAPRDQEYADLLVRIFNDYGVSMSYLPRGFSAGLGAAIDLSDRVDASDALQHLTGDIWYGKYFERPDRCLRVTRGANRIGDQLRVDFVARLLPRDGLERFVEGPASLDIHARSNYVDLNYAAPLPEQRRTALDEPDTHREDNVPVLRRIAGLVETLGVYDLGVVVPGRHGPILVGRTWLGTYADDAEQTYAASLLDGRQIAWFFLDFNEAALETQEAPRDRRVAYAGTSACERRSLAGEGDPLPAPRSL
jgi:hypothetical protein